MRKSVSLIFGSEAKVKIMRLFVFNPSASFKPSAIVARTKEKPSVVRKELLNLVNASLVNKRSRGYGLNKSFRYLASLESFLIDVAPISEADIVKKITRAGNIRLLLTSGVFRHDPESRVDLLVVGDKIKGRTLATAISSLEAQIGRELRYAAFETGDFKYRLGVYDKLLRDILDYPHQKLINKVGV